MKKMVIYPSKIKGTVKISGSKNAALPIIAASMISSKKVVLNNVPQISDIKNLTKVMEDVGCSFTFKRNKLIIESNPFYRPLVNEEIKKIRASYYLMSVFLVLFKKVEILYPGGCSIGSRPIDFHLEGFKSAGCEVTTTCDKVIIKAKKLSPFIYKLPKKSMGATVNLMILASKIQGKSVIENASTEPEIDDLISFLNKGGVGVYRIKNDIVIYGNEIVKRKIKHKIIPDRIEAFTYICIGVNSKKLKIKNINLNHLKTPLYYLEKSNLTFKRHKRSITVYHSVLNNLNACSGDYPALSTDQMPLLYPLLLRAQGLSTFKEGIFENRFDVCNEYIKMGANIKFDHSTVSLLGTPNLIPCDLVAKDLRGAASLLIEAIINQKSNLSNLEYLERGYDRIYEKLKKIGLNFKLE